MKMLKALFFMGLMSAPCYSITKQDLLCELGQQAPAQTRHLCAAALLAVGVAASESLKHFAQCGNQCPAAYSLPWAPGVILLASCWIWDYLPRN